MFLDVFLNAFAKKKEILENMNDIWAGQTCLRPLNYQQHKNRCQKSASALILITLLPLCVQVINQIH